MSSVVSTQNSRNSTDTGLRKRHMHRDYETMVDAPKEGSIDRGDAGDIGENDEVSLTNSCNHHTSVTHGPLPNRTLDGFLEDAYLTTSEQGSWKAQYWLTMLALGVSNSSDASEILCISYILSDETFEDRILEHESWRGGLLASAVFLGMLLGGLLVGTLGDFAGRRPILMLGLMCNAFAGFLSALAPNVWILSFLRCIAGIGIGTTVPPLFTLVAELAPPSQRGLFVTFCASFWMVGSIFVAVTAMFIFQNEWSSWIPISDWRIFAILCAIPSAIGATMVHLLVPESPRFLAMQQQHEEALMVANTLATQMGYHGSLLVLEELEYQFPKTSSNSLIVSPVSAPTTPSSLSEADPLHQRSEFEAHAITQSFPLHRPSSHGTYSMRGIIKYLRIAWYDFMISAKLLYAPQLRQTTWPLQMVWFALSFGSYGLMTWINTLFKQVHLENVYFNALLFALANLPGNILSALLMDRIGRNALLIGSVLASAASLIGFAFFANATSSPFHASGIVVSACAFQCFTIAAWNTIDCMTSELFATSVRATGMGICTASGRIGALVAQLINGFLVANPVRLLLVASSTLVLGAMTPCFLPNSLDMTGRPVQDDVTAVATIRRGGRNMSNETSPYSPITISEASVS